jgi:uncharacterized membrane protein YhaH (DUF805 family)
MFGIGPTEFVIILIILAIILLPIWFISKILNKAGFSGWFLLLSLVPFLNIIALWVFAFVDWPNFNKKTE